MVLDTFANMWYSSVVDVIFADENLSYLESDAEFTAGFSQALVKAFRRRMQQIRAAVDERDFFQLKSLRFEKLRGKRKHQYSMRLNDQYRLIIELKDANHGTQGKKAIKIVSIEDYH
jgi:proteic killer suppression protein